MSSSEHQSLQDFQRGLVSKAQEILGRIESDLCYLRKRFAPLVVHPANPSSKQKPTLKDLVMEAKAKPKEDS